MNYSSPSDRIFISNLSIAKNIAFWVCFFGLTISIPAVLPLVLLTAAVLAPLRAVWAAQALVISWLVSFMNPGLVGTVPGLFFLKLFILTMVGIQVVILLLRHRSVPASHMALFIFGIFSCLISVNSQIPSLSFLKAFLFTLGILCSLTVIRYVPNPAFFLQWLLVMGGAIVVFSLPLVLSGTGYLRNGTGFQGILSHPQAFGMFMSLLTTWVASDLFYSSRPLLPRRLLWPLFVLAVGFLLMSEARVALIAFVVSFVFVGVFLSKGIKGVLYLTLAIFTVGVMLFLFEAPKQLLSEFLLKRRSDVSGLSELYWNSRGEVLLHSLDNFKENFLLGIGFGVPSDLTSIEITYDTTLGIPISAPIEKGFFLFALLEETGIIGGMIFLVALGSLFFRSFTRVDPPIVALAITAVLLNTTENTLFSMSGFGLFIWIILALTSLPART